MPADDDDIVIRGGVPVADNLRRNAIRTLDVSGFLGVSVFVAAGGRDWRELLATDIVIPNANVALSTVSVVTARFQLRKTGRRSYHYDIVLPDLADGTIELLRGMFTDQQPNPVPRKKG